jgi:hypothetical protein
MLRDGPCDVGLAFTCGGSGGAGPGQWADLVVRPLLVDRLVALVPEDHRAAAADAVSLAELAQKPRIADCPRCRAQLVAACEGSGFTPHIGFASASRRLRVGFASASRRTTVRPWPAWSLGGLGVAVLPGPALRAVRTDGVRTLALESSISRQVVALTLPDPAQVPAVAATLGELIRAAVH